MDKHEVLDILVELVNDIQDMRENGETDLRTVIYKIDSVIGEIINK